MRCQRCGSEVDPTEAFCGQCGNPNTPPPSPTQMVSGPLPRIELSGVHRTTNVLSTPEYPEISTLGVRHPTNTQGMRVPFSPVSPVAPPVNSQPLHISAPNQQTGFYQDATEAINMPPAGNIRQGYMPSYQQPAAPAAFRSGFYAGRELYGAPPQPPRMENFTYSPQPAPFSGQNYSYSQPGRFAPMPRKQEGGGAIVLIACICLVVMLISVFGIVTLYLTKDQQNNTATQTGATVTSSPVVTATPALTPTLTPTAIPSPSPTLAPTSVPDAGFLWCGPTCNNYGFSTEYPGTWQPRSTSDTTGVLFTNPAQPDEFAAFKAPGPTSGDAGDLLVSDLQTNFASKPGYTPPSTTTTATIGGETWVTAIVYYQGNTQQQERVTVYATVHEGKAYVIELQAANTQFDAINAQFFANMLARYQFLQTPTA